MREERLDADDLDRPPGEDPLGHVLVRELRADDLDAIVRIDRLTTGRSRRGYYEQRLQTALRESGVRVSLAAELEGRLAGFLLGRVYYGEYGRSEPAATIDTLGVDPGARRRGVGRALLEQLIRNLRALQVERVVTEVSWEQWELLEFLHRNGFRPAPRIPLELQL